MQRSIAVAAILLFAGAATESRAQEGPQPTHIVIRSFQCNPMGQALQYFQEWRPVVQEMVAEGKFIDYGILSHAWGDEWNVVDYFLISDLSAYFEHFSELVQRIGAGNAARQGGQEVLGEPARRPFSELCTAHKDNIYAIVAPAGAG